MCVCVFSRRVGEREIESETKGVKFADKSEELRSFCNEALLEKRHLECDSVQPGAVQTSQLFGFLAIKLYDLYMNYSLIQRPSCTRRPA